MIKAIIGNVGSGKTLSATKYIIDRGLTTYTNYPVKSDNVIRLKKEYFIQDTVVGQSRGREVKKLNLNWQYWQQALTDHPQGFDIVGDEWHNVMHSRQAMTKWNTLLSIWMSQIRKIMGSSERHDFVFITQRIDRVDIAARDLLSEIIYCQKIQTKQLIKTVVIKDGRYTTRMIPKTIIIQRIFKGESCVEKYHAFMNGMKTYDHSKAFFANPYMKYYDSYAFITFGDDVYV